MDRLEGERQGFDSQQRQNVFLFVTASRPALWLMPSSIQREQGALSPGVMRPDCEADHSPPSNAELKNDGAISPTPPYVYMA
jgi:hypothetical protein